MVERRLFRSGMWTGQVEEEEEEEVEEEEEEGLGESRQIPRPD
jgi:hypothetical protein